MDIRDLKEEIANRELIPDILSGIGCHHIQDRGDYITCGNKDGDNPRSIVVYKNEYIGCTNYTRQIVKNGRAADIFDLVAYAENCSFSEAMKFVCNIAGIDFYGEPKEIPESLQIIRMLQEMSTGDDAEDNSPVKPISEKILTYFLPYGNKMWDDQGISLSTQQEFSIMYDPQSNRIVIPLFDSLNSLVGIKGRLMKDKLDDGEQKYLYLTKFNKSKFIFGLNKTFNMIRQQGYCPVFEAEKSVMLAYDHGVGSVAVCGCQMSKYQIDMLTRLDVPIILCLDKDRTEDEIKAEMDKFLNQIQVYYMFDKDNILNSKESPVDDWSKWQKLLRNNVYKRSTL